ncbi:MAG: nucleoid-structuring protein H-NS [Calditrichaeota bacterium]|nr:MAG: nucleoid-structuring protein H-NS [Calditrichota bacterium]
MAETFAGKWLTFRPDLKVLDCTLRDGGLMNNHRFSDEIVAAVYNACSAGGIDYMEVGYKASNRLYSLDEFGSWKFCAEDDIRRVIVERDASVKLAVMADTERTDYQTDICPKEQSIISMIRIAAYIHQIPAAIDMIQDAHDKGYETTINLMAVSTVPDPELDEALELLAKSPVDIIYLVDSFGSLYSEQVRYLLQKYFHHAQAYGKKIGMHAHNNQELAFANTIDAIIMGATIVDGSMGGLGRGAGNCRTESLLSFLHNPKYKIRPVLQCVAEHIEPLRHDLLWGFDIPYMLTGVLNRHPRVAIEYNQTADRGNYVKFFNQIIETD